MPGPIPKTPNTRQRRNRSASRALLPPEGRPIRRTPSLPENPLGEWHELTRGWWRDVWGSPQRGEFLRADLGSLFRLAMLVNSFFATGELEYAREVRLLEREFGLTPLSRRRLEWTVAQSEEAVDRHVQRRIKRVRVIDGDPRQALEEAG